MVDPSPSAALSLIYNCLFNVICIGNICFFVGRDVAVYALGVGACGRNAIDTDELLNMFTVKMESSLP
ncbi:hypothetical protein ERO13_A05G181550v2 [Gossypium hirsutum]|nr:hypothetical protein ERO13_A05G181550v2 [Gossypium hirsutum]